MTIIQDDRTPKQHNTHTILVIGTDSFLSGWGRASGGASYAAWACTPDTADKVEEWVRSRSDMKRVCVVSDLPRSPYRPGRGCRHLHIYVVTYDHPALS